MKATNAINLFVNELKTKLADRTTIGRKELDVVISEVHIKTLEAIIQQDHQAEIPTLLMPKS